MDNILNGIADHGFVVIENALPANVIAGLLTDCQHNQPQFKPAGIGRQQGTQLNATIRKDKTRWFDGSDPAQADYLGQMDQLRSSINRHFFMGLFDYECHYAKYEAGDFYKKHLDAFKGRSNRVLTTVCYLNSPATGGELIIYAEDSTTILAQVSPKVGTLVVFESERFPHEVLAAQSIRYSIAGWFRTNNSLAGTIDPAR